MPKRLFGWKDRPAEVARYVAQLPMPFFAMSASVLRGSGSGKIALLHKSLEQVHGSFPVAYQTIGDCVSHGWALAINILKAVQITIDGRPEEWRGLAASEVIYAGSRVEIGGGRLGNSDGSIGAWAADWVTKYGVVLRGKYGSIDLSEYDGQRAKAWGARGRGVPDELEPIAKEHPVQTVSLVRSYEEARDAIANGYPVPVCSMQGFEARRDAQGFARPRGTWPHCMCFIAVDDADGRPGLLCQNSWGPNWISGPTRHDQPPGSFWVDADVADKMLRGGDSFAISNLVGWQRRKPNFFYG